MRALVTGACGFAGSHLIAALAARSGGIVDGTHRPALEPAPRAIRHQVRLHSLEITDGPACKAVLEEVAPTHLFHLAAPSHVGDSFTAPGSVLSAILAGTVNVLEAAAALADPPRVLFVSSAEVYGESARDGHLLVESDPLRPDSPYGVGKLAAEAYAAFAVRVRGLPVVIARPFNHLGVRQSDRFSVASFAKQIAQAEAGSGPAEIKVGALTAERDFSDVRDIVQGYLLLAERGAVGEAYNLSSGRPIRMARVLDRLLSLSRVPVAVSPDPARYRPLDVPRLQGSAAKARQLGWQPRFGLDETLAELLQSWREPAAP